MNLDKLHKCMDFMVSCVWIKTGYQTHLTCYNIPPLFYEPLFQMNAKINMGMQMLGGIAVECSIY